MTNRKLVIIIAGVVCGIFLLAVLFAGAIAGIIFYSIGHSDAARTARDFLSRNEKLKQDIGEVKEFGSFTTGNINVQNSDGNATLSLKVIGERKTVNATVELSYRSGQKWRINNASYVNDAGETVDLMNVYGPAPPE